MPTAASPLVKRTKAIGIAAVKGRISLRFAVAPFASPTF
jgi:hypothetical protein